MGTQVDASTIRAGQLFSTATFRIPDFQRAYSWESDEEVADFWADLSRNIDTPPYFLGLLITTDDETEKTVVDGQQRIATLSLLANSIRKAAAARNKTLVADSMRDVFLYAIDYQQDRRAPRVEFASLRDRATFLAILENTQVPLGVDRSDALVRAQEFLDRALSEDLEGTDPSARLAKWAHFLSTGITFAIFEHPDRSAAYKVYEIVNTRGRVLTPAELVKSYVIGSAASTQQTRVSEEWTALEEPFLELGADTQFTQFIRNVVTLRHGYVEPGDLYEEISRLYEGSGGVDCLLQELSSALPLYLQLLNPPASDSDVTLRSFLVLDALGLRTVRPIFLAIAQASDPANGFHELFRIIVPRLVAGAFGTGSVERAFAEAARSIFSRQTWDDEIEKLRTLVPPRATYQEALGTRSQSKGVLVVVRCALLQHSVIPEIDGYLHHIRPRNAESWPGFSNAEYREVGGTLGNTIITNVERRPRSSNSLEGAITRLLPEAKAYELEEVRTLRAWTAADVRRTNDELAPLSAATWYE